MAKITVLAGDFLEGHGQFHFGTLVLRTEAHRWAGEAIPLKNLELIETTSEVKINELGKTREAAAEGDLSLRPIALLAGLMRSNRTTPVTFIAWFKDGRKLLATTESGTYTKLQAAIF